MSKIYNQGAGTPNGPKVSASVKSPARTPAEQLTTLGGFPPTKTEAQINDANDPSKRGPAPDVSRGT